MFLAMTLLFGPWPVIGARFLSSFQDKTGNLGGDRSQIDGIWMPLVGGAVWMTWGKRRLQVQS